MDKVTPKPADVLQANRERAAPLLAKLKAEGIGHIIDGKIAPSTGDFVSKVLPDIDGTTLPSIMCPMPSAFSCASSGAARSRLA